MRSSLRTTAAVLGLLAGGATTSAHAQTAGAQSPPAPGAAASMPQPSNSLPAGSATSQSAPGASNLNGSTSQVPTPPSGKPRAAQARVPAAPMPVSPMPAAPAPVGDSATDTTTTTRPKAPVRYHRPMRMRPKPEALTTEPAPANDGTGAPPTTAYRGGVGSPTSTQATNLRPGRELGARLPDPDAAGATPRDYLMAAQTALNRGQTGKAQEALERAETRILSRTTDPSRADVPDQARMAKAIAAARQALANRDIRGAKAAIADAMSERVPPPGPAVTYHP